jgi:molybdenum cofactor cytidylyltransferase
MKIDTITSVVLASGLSKRFSEGPKLLAPFLGKPLCAHAIDAVIATPFMQKIAVVPADNHELRHLFEVKGFSLITNHNPSDGIGSSIALAVQTVANTKAAGMMIVLADMPFIKPAHFIALSDRISAGCATCINQNQQLPPVLFSREYFDKLQKIQGDKGAKRLLQQATTLVEIAITSKAAIDIDELKDITRHLYTQ